MLANAFNTLLQLHGRDMTISRPGVVDVPVNIRMTPSNYFRNLAGPEETTIEGREFVVSKTSLDAVSFPIPRRGDRLNDLELGVNVVTEVREMFDFGGKIIGFRIRTS